MLYCSRLRLDGTVFVSLNTYNQCKHGDIRRPQCRVDVLVERALRRDSGNDSDREIAPIRPGGCLWRNK